MSREGCTLRAFYRRLRWWRDEGSYYAYLHDKPDSIGVGETHGWPTLMVVHEIGHFVDHVGLPGVRYQSVERAIAEMDGVLIAAPWALAPCSGAMWVALLK